ncbi:MAG TPA: GGDEF domain-containing protein [Planctomycetaceae bacterium]|nr:GGDEF domain-containing protein [Planctomycetaceae bacterium]
MTTFVISVMCAAVGLVAAWLTRSWRLKTSVQLRRELRTARQQIASKQHELETYVCEARTDTLTRLKNRRSFNEELSRLFAQRQRQKTVFSLLLIDVDHFKKFNDVYGHLAGDLVLRSVAQVVSSALREMDVVCRYGGEEFAVICPGSELLEAAAAAERVRAAIAFNSVTLKEGRVQVTASLGAAEVINAEIAEGLIQRADEALYSAKHAGRNRVHLHDGRGCVPADQTPVTAATNP